MSDYKKLVQAEAKSFYETTREEFAQDEGEFGGASESPSLMQWIDRGEKLSARINEIVEKWTNKEFRWVQANTRNKSSEGGDPRSNAFVSLLQDVRHEVKKIAKK